MDKSRSGDGVIADDSFETESGGDDEEPKSSGFGELMGALAGAAIGTHVGPAGFMGLAVLGWFLGGRYERRTLERRRVLVREAVRKE